VTVQAFAGTSLWSVFTAKAELLGAAVMRTASAQTATSLLREAAADYVCTASALARFPGVGSRGSAEPAEEVVAAGQFAVAETGSVVVDEPADDRALCFLAERLWLLVPAAELVPTLDVALERIRDMVLHGAPHPVIMSGPSRTADIERVLTVGVHGPRALVIVVVGEKSA
jgi:L-lactate dehydrogenase complex protein LldG